MIGFLVYIIIDIDDKLQGKYWGIMYNGVGIVINIDDKLYYND